MWTYDRAGVDISMQRKVQDLFRRELGIRDAYANPLPLDLTLHVDGVGTKILLLKEYNKLEVAGWDCLMINANDVACEGYKVIAFVDYLAMHAPDDKIAESIARGLSKASEELGAQALGGETAIMKDVVKLDLVCTVMGLRIAMPRKPKAGDKLVALASSGPHANGYTLIRKLIEEGLLEVREELLAPVVNYHNALLKAMFLGLAKTAAHITGGGFSKLRRLGLKAVLREWEIPQVFKEIMKHVPCEEMFKTFNMGVGMVVVTDNPEEAVRFFKSEGLEAWVIGELEEGGGVYIEGPCKVRL